MDTLYKSPIEDSLHREVGPSAPQRGRPPRREVGPSAFTLGGRPLGSTERKTTSKPPKPTSKPPKPTSKPPETNLKPKGADGAALPGGCA
ncbi:hypothetical protein QE152_g13267 [Popillia japonica]|uniref:Uncharacterized protein n=1 Tax=Popillia japonica TaxID=7064 RepID=A0AAW1LCS6_POPJA